MKEKDNYKSTDAEIEQRVLTVYQMILQGLSRQDILQYSSKNWFVSNRTVDTYIKRATIEIGEVSDDEKASAFGNAIKRLNAIYYKAMKKDDLRTAITAQREISELYGLKNQKTEQDNIINITFTKGDEQLL